MPIVFVHGVNVRKGPAYEAGVKVKEAYLKRCFANAKINGKTFGASPTVVFPYWGDLATKFAWNMDSLPRGEIEKLGATTEADYRVLLAHLTDALPGGIGDEPLLALARQNFGGAIELITMMALEHVEPGHEEDTAKLVIALQDFAAQGLPPGWLQGVVNDNQFLAKLFKSVTPPSGVQAQGIGDFINKIGSLAGKLKTAVLDMAKAAGNRAGNLASSMLLAWTRDSLNGILGRFFGDVFIYFNSRGDKTAPGPIAKVILDAIEAAMKAAPAGEPLVVVCHSLGGVITFDLLSHFRPDWSVDLFVSVGSQVAHFEELKLYRVSDPQVGPPGRAKTPANIVHWINVFDKVDIFSYSAEKVFDRVDVDASYDTGTFVIKAHVVYFDQARLYDRIRDRMKDLK